MGWGTRSGWGGNTLQATLSETGFGPIMHLFDLAGVCLDISNASLEPRKPSTPGAFRCLGRAGCRALHAVRHLLVQLPDGHRHPGLRLAR